MAFITYYLSEILQALGTHLRAERLAQGLAQPMGALRFVPAREPDARETDWYPQALAREGCAVGGITACHLVWGCQ